MRTAIIGHGRSPERKAWGPRVNLCDRVVRMWDWDWQDPVDYGSRYDYGLIELHRLVMRRFLKHNQRTPEQGWIASKFPDWTGARPRNSVVVDQHRWLDTEGMAIGGRGETGRWELTRGGVAACWVLERSTAGDEVVLVGCDNLMLGITLPADEAFCAKYQASPAFWGVHDYAAGVTKSGNHDFPAERSLLEHMASRRGVALRFAQNVWIGP